MRRLALACLLLCSAALAQTLPANDSIYQAWGGKAGIRAVMDDFVPRLVVDPRTAPFFKGVNLDNLTKQLTEQLCQEAGGPCTYQGAPMKLVHQDLEIRRRDFNAPGRDPAAVHGRQGHSLLGAERHAGAPGAHAPRHRHGGE